MARSGHYRGTKGKAAAELAGLRIDYSYQATAPVEIGDRLDRVSCPGCGREIYRMALGQVSGTCPACRASKR